MKDLTFKKEANKYTISFKKQKIELTFQKEHIRYTAYIKDSISVNMFIKDHSANINFKKKHIFGTAIKKNGVLETLPLIYLYEFQDPNTLYIVFPQLKQFEEIFSEILKIFSFFNTVENGL